MTTRLRLRFHEVDSTVAFAFVVRAHGLGLLVLLRKIFIIMNLSLRVRQFTAFRVRQFTAFRGISLISVVSMDFIGPGYTPEHFEKFSSLSTCTR